MSGDRNLSQEVLEELRMAQVEARDKQRRADIVVEVAKFKNPSAKRALGHNMNLLHKVEDLKNVFGEEEASVDNIEVMNIAIGELGKQLENLRCLIQHEVDMQVVAGTSPLGWKVVQHLEANKDVVQTCSLRTDVIRKAEKETMAYDRDLRVAKEAAGKERKGYVRGEVRDRGEDDGDVDRFSKFGRRGEERDVERRGKSSRGGGSMSGCYRCGDTQHRVADCKKPYAK